MKWFLIILLIGQACIIQSQNLSFQFAKQMGGAGFDTGREIALDASGNIYVAGDFSGVVDFDPGPGTYTLASNGGGDIYITKTDGIGNFIWAVQIGGPGTETFKGLNLDITGNANVCGYFSGTVDFDPGPGIVNLTANPNGSFILKLSTSGAYTWASLCGGVPEDIATDASGNIYTTGTFLGTKDFDPGAGVFNLTSTGANDIFIMKTDAAGNFNWAKGMGGSSFDRGVSISVDASGNVYSAGRFNGTSDFNPGPALYNLSTFGGSDIYISKLDATGNFVWAKQMGGSLEDIPNELITDPGGNIVIAGVFKGTADFDPGAGTLNLTSMGLEEAFICKLDATGNFNWAHGIGGSGNDGGISITLDALGNVYTGGYFDGTVDFDPSAAVYNLTAGQQTAFIHKLSASGTFVWAYMLKGLNANSASDVGSITVDASLNVFTTGTFLGTVDFDPFGLVLNITSAGEGDIYIQKLVAPCNTPGPVVNLVADRNTVCANETVTLTASGAASYTWGVSLSKDAVVTAALASTTIYTVTGGDWNLCLKSATISIAVVPCTEMSEQQNSKNSLIVYPNPTDGLLTLKSNKKMTIAITNELGQVVQTILLDETNRYEALVEGLSAGLYFAHSGSTYGPVAHKIVVTR